MRRIGHRSIPLLIFKRDWQFLAIVNLRDERYTAAGFQEFSKCVVHIVDQRRSDEASLLSRLLRCCFAFNSVVVAAGIAFSPPRGIA